MPFIGKNGSDAIYIALKHICRILLRYGPKLTLAINQALADGVITTTQRDILFTFISGATIACDVFKLVAGNSGV